MRTIPAAVAALALAVPGIAAAHETPLPHGGWKSSTWISCRHDPYQPKFPSVMNLEWRGQFPNPQPCQSAGLLAQGYTNAWVRDRLRHGVRSYELNSVSRWRVSTHFSTRRTEDGPVPWDTVTLSMNGTVVRFVVGGD